MKKMKKLIVAVMMMAAMAFVLCSCGGGNADGTYVPETVNGQDVATLLEAYKATGQGEMTAEQISKVVISGKNITISAMESIEQSGTCEVSGNTIKITIGGQTKECDFTDGKITMSEGGQTIVYKKK